MIINNLKRTRLINDLPEKTKTLCKECFMFLTRDGMKYHPDECKRAMRNDETMREVFRVAMFRELDKPVCTYINQADEPLLDKVVGYLQMIIRKYITEYKDVCTEEQVMRIAVLMMNAWGDPFEGKSRDVGFIRKGETEDAWWK